MAKISWIIASLILLTLGTAHLHGIFFSEDLHPENAALIDVLNASNIKMDKTGNFWRLWIGFHAMFGVGLMFIGAANFYMSFKHFNFLRSHHTIIILTMISIAFYVWVGDRYIIRPFVIGMAIPLTLFAIGYFIIIVNRRTPVETQSAQQTSVPAAQ